MAISPGGRHQSPHSNIFADAVVYDSLHGFSESHLLDRFDRRHSDARMSHQVAIVPAGQCYKSFDSTGAIVAHWIMECSHPGQRFGVPDIIDRPQLASVDGY